MSNQEELQPNLQTILQRLDELSGRVAELEQKVRELESGGQSFVPSPPSASTPDRPFVMVPPPPEVSKDELTTAVQQALDQLGEADVGAIRTHLARNGMISVTRSDVNKLLYNRKDLFTISRNEGMKPLWKRLS
jgi:hypothetical protein